MLAKLQSKALGAGVLLLSLVAAYFYWQRVTDQRDAYQAEAERQRDRAEILQEHQQWQRQQIETLSSAMADRDRTLTVIADDIRASTSALQSLGESDAEAREWLDSDRPTGITDWVRELQRSADGAAVLRPDSARAPND
ncbi:hypothetical protein [Halomonas campaniensis]|uniref:Uncharacterized protein n=1 Tax=Halomonas campaniensis TaxID=213554 RepID=A0A246RZ66_9GAMM|nr:hypothetical protein [Halomonas campaniensis]OWV29469.1 hypothetical protein JI62_11685 [Halomonas campaniensis]